MSDPVSVVLVTGTLGVGKTALAIDMGETLGAAGHAAAIIDLDWLGWLTGQKHSAGDVDDLIARNLEMVVPNYRGAGATYFVLVRALAGSALLQAIAACFDVERTPVLRLTASLTTIATRLRARDTGVELEEHLQQAKELARILAPEFADLVVANEGRAIREVSLEALGGLGWPSPRSNLTS